LIGLIGDLKTLICIHAKFTVPTGCKARQAPRRWRQLRTTGLPDINQRTESKAARADDIN
jgi:hypothetical protein